MFNVGWRNSEIQNISTLTLFHYRSPNIQQKFSYISHTLSPSFLDFLQISSDFLQISPDFLHISSDFLHISSDFLHISSDFLHFFRLSPHISRHSPHFFRLSPHFSTFLQTFSTFLHTFSSIFRLSPPQILQRVYVTSTPQRRWRPS